MAKIFGDQLINGNSKALDARTVIDDSMATLYKDIAGPYEGLIVYSTDDKKYYRVLSVNQNEQQITSYKEVMYADSNYGPWPNMATYTAWYKSTYGTNSSPVEGTLIAVKEDGKMVLKVYQGNDTWQSVDSSESEGLDPASFFTEARPNEVAVLYKEQETGIVIPLADPIVDEAGLMSHEDKVNLDRVKDLYPNNWKVVCTDVSADFFTRNDNTNIIGVPKATTSTAGVMSAEDKVKLDSAVESIDQFEDAKFKIDKQNEVLQQIANASTGTIDENMAAKITELSQNSIVDVEEDGFYVADRENNVVIKYNDEGFDTEKVSAHFKSLISSNTGNNNTNNANIAKAVAMPILPTQMFNDVPVIKITSTALNVNLSTGTISPLNTSKNKVGNNAEGNIDGSVKMSFTSNTINFEDDINISLQGNSTLRYPKKGFAIKCVNKHKFGNWLENKGFHLKAYYTDWTHARDAVANWMLEQMYKSRSTGHYRPWLKYNDFAANNILRYVDGGAVAHTDQFPIKLYINGTFMGLYSVVTKKDQDNYGMTKTNSNHIMLDADEWRCESSMKWNGMEIRNPEGLKTPSGNDYNGDSPSDISTTHTLSADVRTKIITWNNFMYSINSSTTKDQIEAHVNMEEYIDHLLHCAITSDNDKWRKNTLYCTWDGVHFSPIIYDCDGAFNNSWPGYNGYPNPSLICDSGSAGIKSTVINNLYKEDIEARYAELRNKGVFSVDNIINLFKIYMNWVGQDVYKEDLKIWSYSTFGGNALNDAANTNFYFGLSNLTDWLNQKIEYLDDKYNYNK